ncbi:ras-specific guanine nucleotide-releasing factor 1-like [Oppia nitens]|uniref:ras-specific guanine nucleotide-releasing factor 1-like n=1 Tax=Oppia nitens TaxID=1686743 RepID=UPI0023DA7D10|nr:ras-specific guanine nucleotide-releasing factor 1-like [Oppia nitens]
MQRSLRMNDLQLLALSEKAHHDNGLRGYLFKRTSDNSKWQLRWFVLFQNILFYYENDSSTRPSGLIFLEGSYCDKVIQPSTGKNSQQTQVQNFFTITYRKEGSKTYELKAETESECNAWVHAIDNASFSKTLLQKEELEQKHLHLVQIVESEKTAKWQYTQQCEELTIEIKKLRAELLTLKREWRLTPNRSLSLDEDSEEIRKIKKVQSFFRGWLCRRRWKQIVIEYINSPHAENMRKRNSLVFRMVEAEEEYLEQLHLMVSCYLRPFKMSASSQKPPCSHDEVNSIFLNSETVMFLHQIFLKGLTARMECWPTLVLGDLFDMLLPMLSIYQEYVRNHHFSLQVLAECKQREKFAAMLRRLEDKGVLQGRTLETFLTYPMHQVPRYIITLHELLAHTPHNHVERKSLENARIKLEELSRQMHDEVSETENIRNNLAIERIIVGGCDIILDVNNVFIRKGSVIQVLGSDKRKFQASRIGSFRGDKEIVRQCYLFTNHMLLCTRTSGGKLTLLEGFGKIPLSEATLIEDPNDQFQFTVDDGEGSLSSASSHSSETGIQPASVGLSTGGKDYGGLDFKIIIDSKTGQPTTLHLVAPTMQEKAAWTSDISQCIDNVHFNDLFHGTMNDSSSVTMPHSIRNDPRLFKDDVDIRFSRTLNSCKLPQIRYASPERLFERLTDLRFLSIDFLNTFLLTYRVFTDGVTVLEALKKVHYNPESQLNTLASLHDSTGSLDDIQTTTKAEGQSQLVTGSDLLCTVDYDYSRRISTGSMITDINDLHRESVVSNSESTASQQLNQIQTQTMLNQSVRNSQHWRLSYRKFEEEQARDRYLRRLGDRSHLQGSICSTIDYPSGPLLSPGIIDPIQVPVPPPPSPEVPYICDNSALQHRTPLKNTSSDSSDTDNEQTPRTGIQSESLEVPVHSQSCDTLTADQSYPNSPLSSATSSATLVGSDSKSGSPKPSPIKKTAPVRLPPIDNLNLTNHNEETSPSTPPQTPKQTAPQTPPISSVGTSFVMPSKAQTQSTKPMSAPTGRLSTISTTSSTAMNYLRVRGAGSKRGSSSETESMASQSTTPRSSFQTDTTILSTPRSSFQHPDSPQMTSKAGVVVTSSRASSRRSSTASAASAFAVATAASSNPPEPMDHTKQSLPQSRANSRLPSAVGTDLKIPNSNRVKRESMISTAATMRVLNVLRHWVSKHSQDFENDPKLLQITTEFLEELVHNTSLLPAEHKAAVQLLQMISKHTLEIKDKIDLDVLLSPPLAASKDNIETLSALEIAEVMTYLDHKIFVRIQSEEFLGQAWMKENKTTKAFHILLMTRHFNDISRLVASEIMRVPEIPKRVAIIEKWAAVADICRCLHNFNGVLQICAAFTNSSVFRLKRTWEKVCKTTKQTIDKLQTLVSTDGRFRNMREALHRCDPPCIPYLGMYLTDLSFIEEGTPNFTEEGLLNFSKMRMIAHVIREIRHFQQTPYKIEHNPKVTNYLLDTSRHLFDEELYQLSLCLEPRLSRLGTKMSTTGGSSPSHYSSAS